MARTSPGFLQAATAIHVLEATTPAAHTVAPPPRPTHSSCCGDGARVPCWVAASHRWSRPRKSGATGRAWVHCSRRQVEAQSPPRVLPCWALRHRRTTRRAASITARISAPERNMWGVAAGAPGTGTGAGPSAGAGTAGSGASSAASSCSTSGGPAGSGVSCGA